MDLRHAAARGYLAREIASALATVNDGRMIYVDTTGWLTATDYQDGCIPPTRLAFGPPGGWFRWSPPGWAGRSPRSGPGGWNCWPPVPRQASKSTTAPGWVPGAHVDAVAVGPGDGVSVAQPYDGRAALQATSTVAPLGEWRTISLRPDIRLRVPPAARDLFVYVSPNITAFSVYDVRLTDEANWLPRRTDREAPSMTNVGVDVSDDPGAT